MTRHTTRRYFRGERLKQIRERFELTQTELGDRVGAGQNQIYRYENGRSSPSAEVLGRLATELQVTADWLLGLSDQPNGQPNDELSPEERKLLSAFRRGDLRDLLQVAMLQIPPTSE